LVQQVKDLSPVWQRQCRIQLGEGLEYEAPLPQAWMRNREPWLLDRGVSVEEKVEVDRAWPESGSVAATAERALDVEEPIEELARRQFGVDGGDAVQKGGLVDVTDRLSVAES